MAELQAENVLVLQGEQRAVERLKRAADDMAPGELLRLLDETL